MTMMSYYFLTVVTVAMCWGWEPRDQLRGLTTNLDPGQQGPNAKWSIFTMIKSPEADESFLASI